MASEHNAAHVETQVWETLHSLALEARLARAEGKDLLEAHRHRQINDLLTTWELEAKQPADPTRPLIDRLRIPGAV